MCLLCGIKLGAGRKTLPQQRFLSFKCVTRFDQLPFGSNQIGLRRAECTDLILRIELRQDLSRLDLITNIDQTFDHPPAKPKRKGNLILGLDMAGKADAIAELAVLNRNGPYRANERGGFLGLLPASSQHRDRHQKAKQRAKRPHPSHRPIH